MKARSMHLPEPGAPTTVAILREQYGPRAIIPLDRVMEDYFPGVSQEHLLRRVSEGKLKPADRADRRQPEVSQGGRLDRPRGLPRPANGSARKECRQLCE